MFHFLLICWRDMWRNSRRTLLTGVVMAFAVAVLILFVGIGDGAHTQMIRSMTDSFLGHIQVQHEGYQDDPQLEHRIRPEQLAAVGEVLDGAEGVAGWAPRVLTGGLMNKKVPAPEDPDDMEAYRQMTSEGALLVGVSPGREKGVSTLLDSLQEDDPEQRCFRGCKAGVAELYVDDSHCHDLCGGAADGFEGAECQAMSQGACAGRCPTDDEFCLEEDCFSRISNYCQPARFLAPSDPYAEKATRGELVLGAGLAAVLDVGVGDVVAVNSGTARGRPFAALYRVAGLVKTGSLELNRTVALTHLDKLASSLEIPGAATAIVVAVHDLDSADTVAADIDHAMGGSFSGLRALSWRQLSPELDIFVKIDQGSMLVMLALLVMIVGVIVANVVTMSAMERTREYGVRLALGEPPNRISVGLLAETMLMCLLAAGIGALIGEGLNYYYQVNGIDFGMGEIETTGVVLNTVYHCEMTLYGLLYSVGTVVGFSLVGAVYPAWRIRRLQPVDALRFV